MGKHSKPYRVEWATDRSHHEMDFYFAENAEKVAARCRANGYWFQVHVPSKAEGLKTVES